MTHVNCNMEKCNTNAEGECKSRWIDICDEICMTYEKETQK